MSDPVQIIKDRVLELTGQHEWATIGFAFIGAAVAFTYVRSFTQMIWDCVRPGMPLSMFGAKKGSWAVVTGATAGIGRDFAIQLAGKGFNVFLASRTQSKLDEIAAEITAKFPDIKTQTHSIDFSSASTADYDKLGKALSSLPIGVLINNVGQSYSGPMYYQDLPDKDSADIVEINVNATLKVTKLVLPGMLERKKGLILSVGSFAALVPSPLLAVYSGSKAFLQTWSQALGSELEGTGVHVELLNAYFVVSKLSKIRKSSWFIPTPQAYVKAALGKIGINGGAVGQPYVSTPYLSHALAQWVVDNTLTQSFWIWYYRKLHLDIRARVEKKRLRELKAAKKE